MAGLGSNQEKVGHIDGRDQQHSGHCPQENQQRRAHVSHDTRVKWNDIGRVCIVGVGLGETLLEFRGNRFGPGLRLLEGGGRIQPRHRVEEPKLTAAVRIERVGHPEIHRPGVGDVEVGVEAGRHHADHGEILPPNGQAPAEDVWISAEAPAPKPVAQHDHVALALDAFFGDKGSSQGSPHAEDVEQVDGGERSAVHLGLTILGEGPNRVLLAGTNAGNTLEDLGMVPPVRHLRRRDSRFCVSGGREVVPDEHQAIGLPIG